MIMALLIPLDMILYEDITFNNGQSIIESADFETLVFDFYDDNTLDIWLEYVDYEEIDYCYCCFIYFRMCFYQVGNSSFKGFRFIIFSCSNCW